jgi:NHL repeat-containing protein
MTVSQRANCGSQRPTTGSQLAPGGASSDFSSSTLRRAIKHSGAGDGRPATSLGVAMNLPEGVAADASGNLLIADTRNNRIREVTG